MHLNFIVNIKKLQQPWETEAFIFRSKKCVRFVNVTEFEGHANNLQIMHIREVISSCLAFVYLVISMLLEEVFF